MSVTITIEVDEGIYKEIQRFGLDTEDYLNAILIRELRKEQSKKSFSRDEERKHEGNGKPAEQLIREDRDER